MKGEIYRGSLEKDGFTLVDLLSESEVKRLNDLLHEYVKPGGDNFVSSSHFLSENDSKRINDELHRILKPKTDKLFPELELLGGTLATKYKGNSPVHAHNDWNIVDESQYNSYNLWIPLVDTNSKNGTLGLIPGSHLWQHGDRGMGIPGKFEKYTNLFIQMGYEPVLKAGQAILYNHKLIHYSRPNKMNKPRNVAIVGMKDKPATIQVSFSSDGKEVEIYHAEESDFYGFSVEKIKAKNELIKSAKLNNNLLTSQEIKENYNRFLSDEYSHCNPPKGIISKVFSRLKGIILD